MTDNKHVQTSVDMLIDIAKSHGEIVLANSLSAEDMILTDMIAKHAPKIKIITLDTGRLHEETYELIEEARKKYNISIHVYYPDTQALENISKQQGMNYFYQSVAQRKLCCNIRKVAPLKRALSNKDAWITGLRREQSVTRLGLKVSEWDEAFGLHKYNPLIEWNDFDVWSYIKTHKVPYSTLYDQGYTSIGCAPCTRKIKTGDEARAGRWWWESRDTKECGLHSQKEAEFETVPSEPI